MYNLTIDLNKSISENLQHIKSQCLVCDIETASFYPNGEEINISTDFENYVQYAKVKWIGFYSYKYNKHYTFNNLNTSPNAFQEHEIADIFDEHNILIGFNIQDFDFPILVKNNLITKPEQFLIVDCMTILGKSAFRTKDGMPYKNRGTLMDYDFDSNSLRNMAEEMKLDSQKGDIDYHIFQKNIWSHEETQEIITYLLSDINVTKQMFDKLWEYWLPFTQFLALQDIYSLSWIRGSIASVIYKSACNLIGETPTYADKVEHTEEMGGNVIEPKVEECRNVYYIDFSSLYPHIMTMFNLFAEVDGNIKGKYVWHGNETFKVKGYYDISHPYPLSKMVTEFLKKRLDLKKTDPKNPLVYSYKIFLNGLYGVVRSAIFEKVHKPNAGWDTAWLGQQCQKLTKDRMLSFGFETIAGDTDSLMVYAIDPKNDNETYLRECLKKIVDEIKENAPFKIDTFDIALEHKLDYIMFPFDAQPVKGEDGKNIKLKNRLVKERKGKKKNYLYLYTEKGETKIEIKGLPIIKNNATALGFEIYENVLKEKIIKKGNAKFTKEEMDNILKSYLQKPNILETISQEYKAKTFTSYKLASQLQAQISKNYFGGGDGVIRLIKNNKVGKVGKGKTLYCSIEEAQIAKLDLENLDLTKVYNELEPFIVYVPEEVVLDKAEISVKSQMEL